MHDRFGIRRPKGRYGYRGEGREFQIGMATPGTALLDPLGAGVEPDPAAWFEIMRDPIDSIADCLGDA